MLKLENITLDIPVYDLTIPKTLNRYVIDHILKTKKKEKNFKRILDNITLELNPGESLGIIGKNGSGKTSLLRTLAGVYKTYSGKLTLPPKVASFLDLNACVNNELSGIENILLITKFLEKDKKILEKKQIEDIIEFSGLKDSIFNLTKTYSSGMRGRLMFASSTYFSKDLILIDENIFVGDKNFHKQAVEKINKMKKEGCSIILASHSEELLKKYCEKGLYLKKGIQENYGEIDKVIKRYNQDE